MKRVFFILLIAASAHAQLVRLAWSAAAGRPVERPGIVACHYAGVCS